MQYLNINKQSGVVWLKSAKRGRPGVPTAVGRFGRFWVRVLGFFGLPTGQRRVLQHFRIALNNAYGQEVSGRAMQQGGMDRSSVCLTGGKVRQVLEFADAIKRDTATTIADKYTDALTTDKSEITSAIKSKSGVDPATMSKEAIAYFSHHFKAAMSGRELPIPSTKAGLDGLAAEFVHRADKMDKKMLADKSVAAATEVERGLDSMIGGIKEFDAVSVLSGGIRIDRHFKELGKIEGMSHNPADHRNVYTYVTGLTDIKKTLRAAVLRVQPGDRVTLRQNIDLMLEAEAIASNSRADKLRSSRSRGAVSLGGDDKIIGAAATRGILQGLKDTLDEVDARTVDPPRRMLHLSGFRGLAATASAMDAVVAFGGRPENLPQYEKFQKRLAAEMGKFSAAKGRVPSTSSPIFKKLFSPRKPRDVRAALNILKKHFDGKIAAAADDMEGAVTAWRDIGNALATDKKTAEEKVPPQKIDVAAQRDGKYKKPLAHADDAWLKAIVPIEGVRQDFLALSELMKKQANPLTKAGGEKLGEMLTFYPWSGADSKDTSLEQSLGVLAMPLQFQLAADRTDTSLGASWQLGGAALSSKYLPRRSAALGKVIAAAEPEVVTVGDRHLKVDRQFTIDLLRQNVSLVTNGKAEPLVGDRIAAAASGNESDIGSGVIADSVKKLADYIGNDEDLLAISALMSQSISADSFQTYNRGEMLSPIAPGSARRDLGAVSKHEGPGIHFNLEKLDNHRYKLTWRQPSYVAHLKASVGIPGGRESMVHFNYKDAAEPTFINEEEILLARAFDNWEVSLPVERVEIKAPTETF